MIDCGKTCVANRDNSRNAILVALLGLVVIFVGIYPAESSIDIGSAKTVINRVYGNSLLLKLKPGDRLSKGQRIHTGLDSSAELMLLDETILYVGERSDIALDSMFFDKNENKVSGVLRLARGVMRYASSRVGKTNVTLKTPNAVLGVRGTVFDVMSTGKVTEIIVRKGRVSVDLPSGSQVVSAGQVFRIPENGQFGFEESASQRMQSAVSNMLQMVGVLGTHRYGGKLREQLGKTKTALAREQPSRNKKKAKIEKLGNTLLLDLTYGRVTIEMDPIIAPKHVIRVKELVRQGFYDGQKFHNVVPGFVVETGDPTGEGSGGSGKQLRAEISDTSFTRGIVGMKRHRNNLHTADSQFFILLGDARHIEGLYTAWGRVTDGLQLLDRIRAGSPPDNPDHIVRIRVASDMVN